MSSNKILSTQLCTGIAEWFKQNVHFNDKFKSIVDYVRIDFPHTELPAIAVYYYKSPNLVRDSWNETGTIAIDVVFSLQDQRSDRAKEIVTTLEMIRAQILDNPNYIQQFVSANYVPGLISMSTNTDMRDLANLKEKMLKSKNGALVITFTMEYKINVLLNQRAIWNEKKDYYSPDNEIYNDAYIGEVKVKINP